MRKIILIYIISVLHFSCGTSKLGTKKTSASNSQEKPVVSAEIKSLFYEGVHSYIISDYDNSLKQINKYIALNPTDDAAYFLQSKIYQEKKDSVAAVRSLEKAYALDKNNKWYNVYLGTAYSLNKEYQKAIDLFEPLSKKEPNEIEYKFNLYEAYYGLKEFPKCLEILDDVERISDPNPELYYQRYAVYINMRKYDLAEKALIQSVELYPEDHRSLFALNDFYNTRNQKQKMIDFLERIVITNPDSGSVNLLLAEYYLKQNKIDKAAVLLEKVYSNPEVDITYKRYFLLDNSVDNQLIPNYLAEKIALSAAALDTEDGFFNLFLGNIYDNTGNLDKALFYYKKSVERNKNNKETLTRIAFLEYQNQDYDSLVVYATKALELFPSNPDFYYLNSLGLLRLKRYDEAISVANSGLVYAVDKSAKEDLSTIIAESYFGKKEYQKGREIYEKTIRENPNDIYLKNNLALVMAKNDYELDDAMLLVNQINELDPNNENYLFTKGMILFKKGNYKEAIRIVEPLIVTNPKDAALHSLIGDLYFKLGNLPAALDYWNIAKNLGFKGELLIKKIDDKKYYDEVE